MSVATGLEIPVRLDLPRRWPWLKFPKYVMEIDHKRGELLRAEGAPQLLHINPLLVSETLASWGTPPRPQTQTALLRLVNEVGLTGPWEPSNTAPTSETEAVGWWRPPAEQTLDDLSRDIAIIADALHGYEVGVSSVLQGKRAPSDRKATIARMRFSAQVYRVVGPFFRHKLALLMWTPAEPFDAGFSNRLEPTVWPSLLEIAMLGLVQIAQDAIEVRRCENPDCGRPFTSQVRGGDRPKRWDRPNVKYCSIKCAKHAAYLKKKAEMRGKNLKGGRS